MVTPTPASYKLEMAQRRIAELQAQVRKHEEDEASVCPEDVGFVEYIKMLEQLLKEAESDRDYWKQAKAWEVE